LSVFWNRNAKKKKKKWVDPNYPHVFWDSLVNFVFGYLIEGVVHLLNADEAIGVTLYNQPVFRKILPLTKILHLSHEARGIDSIPTIHEGAVWYIKDSKLKLTNMQILKENAAKIREDPELVFQKLSINKPIFTKEQIAIALADALAIDFELGQAEKQIGSSDGSVDGSTDEQMLQQNLSQASNYYKRMLRKISL
jgi:hypothetical protein